MAKRSSPGDFRSLRELLPDEVFLVVSGNRSGPTDLVPEEVWNGLMHLPDHVSLTTSDHHGKQLAVLYALWGDWLDLMLSVMNRMSCLRGCSTQRIAYKLPRSTRSTAIIDQR